MDLGGAALRLLARPAVLHAIPGRIRLAIPLLRKLPRKSSGADGPAGRLISALLAVPVEISRVETNVTTGTVLIQYDAARATEKAVVGYVKSVLDLAVRNRDRIGAVPPGKVPVVAARMEDFLRDALSAPLTIDSHLEIPDHVLA